MVMIHLSKQARLINFKQDRYNLCVRHLQIIVKNYGQLSFNQTMKYRRAKFYANTSLSSLVLCCKHYISMYLDEYLIKEMAYIQSYSLLSDPEYINIVYICLHANYPNKILLKPKL